MTAFDKAHLGEHAVIAYAEAVLRARGVGGL